MENEESLDWLQIRAISVFGESPFEPVSPREKQALTLMPYHILVNSPRASLTASSRETFGSSKASLLTLLTLS